MAKEKEPSIDQSKSYNGKPIEEYNIMPKEGRTRSGQIMGDINKTVPLELRERIKTALGKSRYSSIDYWSCCMVERGIFDKMAFGYDDKSKEHFFRYIFGFIKTSNNCYKFQAIIVKSLKTDQPYCGRNNFKDEDFEGIVSILLKSKDPKETFLKVKSKYKIYKLHVVMNVMNLCQFYINGMIHGPTPRKRKKK